MEFLLHGFSYMNPNPSMYVLLTWHEHLGWFHSLIFRINLISLGSYFSGSCCQNWHPLHVVISSPRCTFICSWLSRSLRFLKGYGIFLNTNISLIVGRDRPFRHLQIWINSCWIFLLWILSLVFLKVRSSSCKHFGTIV